MTESLFDKHPSALTDAERQTLSKLTGDADDGDAADTDAGSARSATSVTDADADAGAAGAAATDDDGDADARGDDGAGKPAAATSEDDAAGKAGDSRAPMIPKARFDEVNGELKDLKSRLESLEAQRQAVLAPIATDRDFAAEKKALQQRYDDGEIDISEYMDGREAIVIEEAKHAARVEGAVMSAELAKKNAQDAWDAAVNAWQTKHADFLANQVRRDIVEGLFEKLGADPNLTNEQLIAQVEKQAFEAFNYTPPGAGDERQDTNPAPRSPHAARNAADAAAIAAAGSAPPTISGGLGDRGRTTGIDVMALKPGQFKNLPREKQAELLGGEDAL
jgi:hypothetical protein